MTKIAECTERLYEMREEIYKALSRVDRHMVRMCRDRPTTHNERHQIERSATNCSTRLRTRRNCITDALVHLATVERYENENTEDLLLSYGIHPEPPES